MRNAGPPLVLLSMMCRPVSSVGRLLFAAAAAGVVLTGCTAEQGATEGVAPEGWSTSGTPTAGADTRLGREQLVDELTDALPVNAPLGSFEVTCDGPLAGVVGATQVCAIERQGGRTGALLETTAVDGDSVQWEEQYFLFAEDLESALPAQVEQRGGSVDSVECPSSLPGDVGATMTCPATGGSSEVVLTVTGVQGLTVDFDFETR